MLLRKLCPGCRTSSQTAREPICPDCQDQLRHLPARQAADHLSLGCRALFLYDAAASGVVQTIKDQRAMWLVRWLAPQLEQILPDGRIDCLTWIPAARANWRKRGYDQGELLTRALSRQTGIPARALLRRRQDLPQVRRDRSGRLEGPALVPRASRASHASRAGHASRARPYARVVVVDDVITTGTSMRRAAEVLLAGGTAEVGAIAVAGTAERPRRANHAG